MSIKYVSGRVKELKVGLSNYSETRDALSVIGNVNVGGIVTATSFSGGGISTSGTSEFTNLDLSGNLDVDGQTDLDEVVIAGVSTFNDDVQFKGALYDALWDKATSKFKLYDLTQIAFGDGNDLQIYSDGTYGIIKGNDTTKITGITELGVSGVSTFTENVNIDADNKKLQIGDSQDLQIYHSVSGGGSTSYVDNNTGPLYIRNNVDDDDGGNIIIEAKSGKASAVFQDDEGVRLYYNDAEKFTTTNEGVLVSGGTTTGTLTVTGVSTYQGNLDIESSVLITGITTIGGLVDINAGAQANTLKVEDLTDNRVVIVGTGGELEDSANLTFDGTTFNVGSGVTIYQASGIVSATSFYGDGSSLTGIDASALKFGGVVKAQANQSGVVVTGVLTATSFSGTVPSASLSGALPAISGANLTDVPTGINTGGTSGFTDLEVSGTLSVGGTSIFNSPIVGVATFSGDIDANGNLDVDGQTDLDDVNVSGVATIASAKVSDLTNGRVVYAGAGGELQDSGNLTFNGTTLSASAFAGDGSQITNLPGIDTAGGSVFTNILSSGINTLGKGANGITYLYHADSLKFTTTGIGVSVASGTGKTAYIEGPEEIWIDPHPSGVGTTSGIVRIRGDLYVDGAEVIVDVEKLEIGDFQIGIATTAGTNTVLDGAGIGIGSTSIRKTITWNNATNALMCSENWNVASGKHYEINGTDVLTSTTLGSGVVNSSLTSLGTIASLTASTAKVSDLTNTRVVYAGASGELQDSANLTYNGSTLAANGINVSGNILAPNAGNFVAIGTANALGAGTDRLALLGSSTDSGVRIWASSSTHKATSVPLQVADYVGTELFRVHGDGNIGVGSAAPSAKIDVAGTVKATDFDSTSDIRLKTNVQVIENPLDKVIQIEGVSFNWKENNKPALGVIADQVQKIIPELVHGDNPKTVNYNGLIGLLIEAVKEQQIQIDELKSKLP